MKQSGNADIEAVFGPAQRALRNDWFTVALMAGTFMILTWPLHALEEFVADY
jgi:hypothetical protein